MIIRPPVTTHSIPQQNYRRPLAIAALRWFWRFSQFYGEYTVRSPQAKQTWIAEQLAEQHR